MSKFTGADGRKPSTEARRYVYRRLAKLLEDELNENEGIGWLWEGDDIDEFDRRRIRGALMKVVAELHKKADS